MLIFSQFGGYKSNIKVPLPLVSDEASLLGLQTAASLLSSHGPHTDRMLLCLIKTTVLVGQGLTLSSLLTLITSLKALSQVQSRWG